MALSFVRSAASGSTDTFSVPFGYLDKSHVKVYLNGVLQVQDTDYTWPTTGSIQFTSGNPAMGTLVERRRVTPTDQLTVFSPGNLASPDLNRGDLQPLYLAQEADDKANDILARGWLTKDYGASGTIEKGAVDIVPKFDADGNMVPGPTVAEVANAEGYANAANDNRVLAEAARDAALAAVPNVFPANRAALEVVNPISITSAFLKESRRAGQFFVVDYADFSTMIDADTQQGIFVRSTTDPTKAWMRAVTGTVWWMEWFGAVTVALGGADQAPAFNGMMAVANIAKPSKVYIGAGFFPCHSRITTPTFQFDLEGVISGGQQTILYKEDYVEAVAGRGLISAATHGIQLRNIVFGAGSGSGGSLVSVIPPGPSGMTGDTSIDNCNLTAGNFVDVTLYIDGQANVSAGPGVRDMRITNTTVFGALTGSLYAVSVRALWVIGCNLLTSGGSGSQAVIIGGTVGVPSDIVNIIGGGIFGGISLDKCGSVLIDIPSINSNVTNTADVTNSVIRAGVHTAGTLEHDWTTNSRYDIGARYRDRVSAYLSATVNNVTGAGGTGGGSPHTIVFDTLNLHIKNWEGSQNYNTSNGRYTARYSGDHEFTIGLGLLGLTSVHNRYTLKTEQYTSGGVQLHAGTRQQRGAAFADADSVGQTTLLMSVVINMSAGDYVIFTLDIEQVGAAGSAVVDLRGGGAPDRWSWFEAKLAA